MGERGRDGFPPSIFYEGLRLPSKSEMDEWTSLPLYPEEAHTILINSVADGVPMSPVVSRTLDRIIWGDRGEQDYLVILEEEITKEKGYQETVV